MMSVMSSQPAPTNPTADTSIPSKTASNSRPQISRNASSRPAAPVRRNTKTKSRSQSSHKTNEAGADKLQHQLAKEQHRNDSADNDVAINLNFGLGITYKKEKRYEDSIHHFKEALAGFEKSAQFGSTHNSTIKCLQELGHVYYTKKSYDKALDFYNKTMERIGSDSSKTDCAALREVLRNMAAIYDRREDNDRALEYYQKLAEEQGKDSDIDPSTKSEVQFRIAVIHARKSEHDVALTKLQEVLSEREARLGSDDPATIEAVRWMGFVAASSNDIPKGAEYYDRVFLWETSGGRERHADGLPTAPIFELISKHFRSEKVFDKAATYARRAVHIYDKISGKKDPQYLAAARLLGDILSEDEKPEDARRCYKQCLAGYQMLGDEKATFEIAHLLAAVQAQLNDVNGALETYDLALKGFLKTEPHESQMLTDIVSAMSSLYTKQRKITYTRQKFENALRGFEDDYSDATLDVLRSLAKQLDRLNQYDEALIWLSRVVEATAKAHGAAHESTRSAIEEMSKILPLVPHHELHKLRALFKKSLRIFNDNVDIPTLEVLQRMARRFRKKDSPSQCLYWLEFVLNKYETNDKDAHETIILDITREMAEVEEKTQNWSVALTKYETAANGYAHAGVPESALKCVKSMMKIVPELSQSTEYEAASKVLLGTLDIYDDHYPDEILSGLLGLAQALDKREQKSKSFEWFDRVLARYSSETPSEATLEIYSRALRSVVKRAGGFAKKEDYEKALKWYRRAISASIEIWGRDYPTTLDSIRAIISIVQDAKKYNSAPLDEALKSYDGQYPATLLHDLSQMAANFVDRNHLQLAHDWYQRVLTGYELSGDLNGSEHHQKALEAVRNTAADIKDGKSYEKSLQWYKMALASCTKMPNADHTKCKILFGMASVAADTKDIDEAVRLLNSVLDIACTDGFVTEGNDSKKIRDTALDELYALGVAAREAKDCDVDKVYQILESCLLRYESLEPEGAPTSGQYTTILRDIRHMASNRSRYYDPKKALAWYGRALAGYERVSKDHEEVFRVLHSMGIIQRDMGDTDAAATTLARVIAGFEQQYGPSNTRTISAMEDIADVYQQKGEVASSLEWHVRAHSAFSKNRPSTHPDVLRRTVMIAELYRNTNKETSLEWYTKASAGYKKSRRFGETSQEYLSVNKAIVELNPPPPPSPAPPVSSPEESTSLAGSNPSTDTPALDNATVSASEAASGTSVNPEDPTADRAQSSSGENKPEKPGKKKRLKNGMKPLESNTSQPEDESSEKRKRKKRRSQPVPLAEGAPHETRTELKSKHRKSRPASISEASKEASAVKREHHHKHRRSRSAEDPIISQDGSSDQSTKSKPRELENLEELLKQAAEKVKAKENHDALELYQRALSMCEKSLGQSHHKSLDIVEKIASILKKQKRYVLALECYARVYTGTAKDSDPKRRSDAVKTLRRMIAILPRETGSYSVAAKTVRRALSVRREITDDKKNLTALHKAATKMCKRKQYVEALEWFRVALDGRTRTKDDAVHRTMHMMAKALAGAGKHAEAVKLCRLALEEYSKMDGPDSETTLKVAHDLKRLQKPRMRRRK